MGMATGMMQYACFKKAALNFSLWANDRSLDQ